MGLQRNHTIMPGVGSLLALFTSLYCVLGRRLHTSVKAANASIGMKLWAWNSGNSVDVRAHLRAASDELFAKAEANPTIKVVAVCQTEATQSITDFVDKKKWLLVGHGQHWGSTGLNGNAQILSVFHRQPGGIEWSPQAPLKIPAKGALKGLIFSDYVSPATRIPGLLSTSTQVHDNSDLVGKGGVSVQFVYEPTRMSVAIICAHLDSQKEDKRDQDFLQLLRDGTERESLRMQDLKSTPESLFDTSSYNKDAVVLFGDLNYRIKYQDAANPFKAISNDDANLAEYFGGVLRKSTALDDQLNPEGTDPKIFVQRSPRGFGLQCNQPHTKYLPTYQRHAVDKCVLLHKKLKSKSRGEILNDSEQKLVKMCYVGDLQKPWKKKEGNKYLSIGWVDRFCWRSIDQSAARVELVEGSEEGWHHVGGADHVPIEMDLRFTPASQD